MVSLLLSSVGGMITSGFGVKEDAAICMDGAFVLHWMWRMSNDGGSEFMVIRGGFGSVGGGSAGEWLVVICNEDVGVCVGM